MKVAIGQRNAMPMRKYDGGSLLETRSKTTTVNEHYPKQRVIYAEYHQLDPMEALDPGRGSLSQRGQKTMAIFGF